MSLNTPVILKSRVTPLRDDGERAADDLVGAEALDRFGLRDHGGLRRRSASCPASSGRLTTFRKSSSANDVVLGRRRLAVLDEHRLVVLRM